MKQINRVLLCAFFAIAVCFASGAQVVLNDTEQFICPSSLFPNEPFTIHIAFPQGYQKDVSYPVVYFLDSDPGIGLAKGIVDLLIAGNEIEPFILVGIAYGKDMPTWWINRSRDYTPSLDTISDFGKHWPKAGNADNFIAFFRNDLIPTINTRYNVDITKNTILGFSFGGLFSEYVLFTNNDLFTNYIIISPVTQWDKHLVLNLEKQYYEEGRVLDKNIFISLSSLESPYLVLDETKQLIDSLKSRNYTKLKLEYKMQNEDTHYSGYPKAIVDGFKAILPKK